MGPLKKKKLKKFSYVLDPRWTIVPNLLHFGWNFKHKPPQATDSPHPFFWISFQIMQNKKNKIKIISIS